MLDSSLVQTKGLILAERFAVASSMVHPNPGPEARSFYAAAPKSWGLDPKAAYPSPIIALSGGRDRALAAYAQRNG